MTGQRSIASARHQPVAASAPFALWLDELLATGRKVAGSAGLWCYQLNIPSAVLMPSGARPYELASRLLTAAAGQWRALWQPKASGPAALMVGIGRLDLPGSGGASGLADLPTSQAMAAKHPSLHWFGGLSFDDRDSDPQTWGLLASGGFFSPRLLLDFSDDGIRVTLHVLSAADGPPPLVSERQLWLSLWHRLNEASPAAMTNATREEESPDYNHWRQLLATAVTAATPKVVVARQKTYHFATALDAATVIQRLATVNPGSYLFALSSPDDRCFVGCSPERLTRWQHSRVEIDAMAGTRPANRPANSQGAEQEPATELQANPKDQNEHRFVTDFIHDTLRDCCEEYRQSTTESVVRLRHVQHLVSQFEGQLKPDQHPLDLVATLHPTPAVGGSPQAAALDFIKDEEPFSRGRFAAPVGCFTAEAGDFAIGIRSALIADDRLHVFAGAGIVAGSDPEAEWQETADKMKNFTDMMTGHL